MNEINEIVDELIFSFQEDSISHYGKAHDENPPGRGSGRYAWGEGNRQHQHDWDLMARYTKLRRGDIINPDTGKKYTESEIAALLGYYTTDRNGNVLKDDNSNPKGSIKAMRAAISIASQNKRKDKYAEFKWYDEEINPDTGKHYTDKQIAKLMGLPNESSVRSMRKSIENDKISKVSQVAEELKAQSEELGYIDIGKGVERTFGTSKQGLETAAEMLKAEGYTIQNFKIPNASDPNKMIEFKVLCPPGTPADDNLWKHPQDVKRAYDPSDPDNDISATDFGASVKKPPEISLDRIKIKYAEDGGTAKDGMCEIRAVRDENGNLVAASPDLSLGNARYAQIRIGVEGDRYIKGMAVYNDNLPKGIDILVNSNKSVEDGVDKALKPMEKNDISETGLAVNPFGASVIPTYVRDKNGKILQDKNGNDIRSAINIVGATEDDAHVEGRWGEYSKNLPAQFLSKQGLSLVKQQLKMDSQSREDEYNDILAINNPVIKKKALIDYAESCDKAASDLKAAPIAGQKYNVLLAVPSLKDTECYCPSLPNGSTVALVRFPHAGPFEIPICKVNNSNKEGIDILGRAKDAVGINQHVASELSGADYDGDTAIVIPLTDKNGNSMNKIKGIGSTGVVKLPHLDGFDPTAEYGIKNSRFSSMVKVGKDGKEHPTYPYFKTDKAKGTEMGKITNLITDMYAKGGATPDELSRAVRYSMVVIDAKKHELNYRQAQEDLNIKELYAKYQNNGGKAGASTIMSRAGAEVQVAARDMWSADRSGSINPKTGEKIYTESRKQTTTKPSVEYVKAPSGYKWIDEDGNAHRSTVMHNPDGTKVEATWDGQIKQHNDGSYYYDRGSGKTKWVRKETKRTTSSTRMAETNDARTLMSKNPSEVEKAYATYANHMKTLANTARLASLDPTLKQVKSPEAAKKYSKEVQELNTLLVEAEKNSGRERQANILATSLINAAVASNKDYYSDKDHRKKLRTQCVNYARKKTGAKRHSIVFTDKQWEAINAGAISDTKLDTLIAAADKESYMKLAMPKRNTISDAKKARIRSLFADGWTQEQIADAVGVSTTSVSTIVSK